MRRHLVIVLAGLFWVGMGGAATVYQPYQVQPGDTVELIASRHGMSPDELRALNSHLLTNSLTPLEKIIVMVRGGAQPSGTGSAETLRVPASSGGENAGQNIRGAGGPKMVVADGSGPQGSALAPPGAQSGRSAAVQVAQPSAPEVPEKSFAAAGVVGRLGRVRVAGASIHTAAEATSPRLFQCEANAQLVVIKQRGDWYGIGMEDGSTGWIDTSAVELTSTELVPAGSQPAAAPAPAATAPTASFLRGRRVVEDAYRYLGVRYLWGGNGFRGIDCSGLVQQAYRKVGVGLPRVSRDQFHVGQRVDPSQLQAGDRLYFASGGTRIDHTGLYIANGQFIHASGRHRQVTISNLFDPSYWRMFVGARR